MKSLKMFSQSCAGRYVKKCLFRERTVKERAIESASFLPATDIVNKQLGPSRQESRA